MRNRGSFQALALWVLLAFVSPARATVSLAVLDTSPTATTPRAGHAAVYDPVRDRMLVFGGETSGDVACLSLAGAPAWSTLETSGFPPPARENQTMVYDSGRDRLIVFGGRSLADGAPLNDVWALTLSGLPTWTQLQPAGPFPPARYQHVAVFDPVADRMLVHGGSNQLMCLATAVPFDDVWVLEFSPSPHWTSWSVPSPHPPLRVEHAAAYDPVGRRLIVAAGVLGGFCWCNCGTVRGDTWALSLDEAPVWSQLPSIAGGWALSLVLDATHGRLLSYGGAYHDMVYDINAGTSAFWLASNQSAYLPPEVQDTDPFARWDHSAVYDPVRGRMLVFGGHVIGGGVSSEVLSIVAEPSALDASPRRGPSRLAIRPIASPSHGMLVLEYELPVGVSGRFEVFDAAGRRIGEARFDGDAPRTGTWRFRDGAQLAPGLYFVRVQSGASVERARVVVLE